MTEKQVHLLATICTRFAEQKHKCKAAADGIADARHSIFAFNLDTHEKRVLLEAQSILRQISDNSGQTDAIEYFNNLKNKTND